MMTRGGWLARFTGAAIAVLALSGCAYGQADYAGAGGLYAYGGPYDYGYYDGYYGPNFFVGVPFHHHRFFGHGFHGHFHGFHGHFHGFHGGYHGGFHGFGGHGRG